MLNLYVGHGDSPLTTVDPLGLEPKCEPIGPFLDSYREELRKDPYSIEHLLQPPNQELDESVGLVYFGFRFYGPRLARWLSKDPIRYVDGANRNSFVRGNPIVFVDILGLCSNGDDGYALASWAATGGPLSGTAGLLLSGIVAFPSAVVVDIIASPVHVFDPETPWATVQIGGGYWSALKQLWDPWYHTRRKSPPVDPWLNALPDDIFPDLLPYPDYDDDGMPDW
jgi:RHS repeat-associated protein